jgi:hypothetical protein
MLDALRKSYDSVVTEEGIADFRERERELSFAEPLDGDPDPEPTEPERAA